MCRHRHFIQNPLMELVKFSGEVAQHVFFPNIILLIVSKPNFIIFVRPNHSKALDSTD